MENLTISALLDRVRETQNLKSDYQLGKRFGYAHQKIGNWRHQRTMPDEKACEELARAAGLDPDVVIAQVNALRANEPTSRAIWERIAARLSVASGTVATAILSLVFSMSFVASDAYASSAGHDQRLNDRELTVYTSCIVFVVLLFLLLACNDSDSMARVTFPWVPTE